MNYSHFRVLEDIWRSTVSIYNTARKFVLCRKASWALQTKKRRHIFLVKVRQNLSDHKLCHSIFWVKIFFSYKREKKSCLSDLGSHTMAVVEVAPPLIFSQLDSCLPPCLLWSSHSHPRGFCQPASCQISMESNTTPCSLMIKDTQVRRHRATYNCHLKEWAISPPSLTTTLPRCQEMEHIDQNKAKRSGFEDVMESLSSQKLLDKELR